MNKALKDVRLALGYSQQEMADCLNCNLRTYRGYEYETRGLPNEILSILNTKLNVNINWLITGLGAMFVNTNINTLFRCDNSFIDNKILSVGSSFNQIQKVNNLKDVEMEKILVIFEDDYIDIKNGQREPNFRILNNIKRAFNISIDWLLYGE